MGYISEHLHQRPRPMSSAESLAQAVGNALLDAGRSEFEATRVAQGVYNRMATRHLPSDLQREWHAAPPAARRLFNDNIGQFLAAHKLRTS
ncbi:MAG: hypothetical protein H6969_12100 [Gammaproteobacteria bacterium]|nr:hypothetical protein [Candidatus Competibacteraceae bacterium]MCP5421213.1 hypothetical protein [Gammaproteobacteria bacterium]